MSDLLASQVNGHFKLQRTMHPEDRPARAFQTEPERGLRVIGRASVNGSLKMGSPPGPLPVHKWQCHEMSGLSPTRTRSVRGTTPAAHRGVLRGEDGQFNLLLRHPSGTGTLGDGPEARALKLGKCSKLDRNWPIASGNASALRRSSRSCTPVAVCCAVRAWKRWRKGTGSRCRRWELDVKLPVGLLCH